MTIPLTIRPTFWLTAGFLGWISSDSIAHALIWVIAIFFSLLVHEYGHAWTARAFGADCSVELYAFGGLTHQRLGPTKTPDCDLISLIEIFKQFSCVWA